jgi:hypothetical protein
MKTFIKVVVRVMAVIAGIFVILLWLAISAQIVYYFIGGD